MEKRRETEGARDCRSCLGSVPHREHGNISALSFFFSLPRHSFIILHRCEAGATLAEAWRGSPHAEALIAPLFFSSLSLSFSPSWVYGVEPSSTNLYTSGGTLLEHAGDGDHLGTMLSVPSVVLQTPAITFVLPSLLHLSTPAHFWSSTESVAVTVASQAKGGIAKTNTIFSIHNLKVSQKNWENLMRDPELH